jgi:3-deoxy-D-manno-octulosonic-acid transferase
LSEICENLSLTFHKFKRIWSIGLRLLYNCLLMFLLPIALIKLWKRSLKSPAYRLRWKERLGYYEDKPSLKEKLVIVVHAVSVGEVHAALPLVEWLLNRAEKLTIVVTTTTPTGAERVRQLLGDRVQHYYLPWDYSGAVKRFLIHVEPQLIILMETELWPNLIHYCHQWDIKLVLANARLSARSAQRYQRFSNFTATMLRSLDHAAVQHASDAERLQKLGLPIPKTTIIGTLKYDMQLDEKQRQLALGEKERWGSRPVWIAASTREGEEGKVLVAAKAILQSYPDALLILVPRHPERFSGVAAQALKAGLLLQRYSDKQSLSKETQVLLGDTMGQLSYFYYLAEVAFVGGSLVDMGCQNVIEPAAIGLPIFCGPSRFNFQQVTEDLESVGALKEVGSAFELAMEVSQLFADGTLRRYRGSAARELVAREQGAGKRLQQLISGYL